MFQLKIYSIYFCLTLLNSIEALPKSKDNGDIYITQEKDFIKDIKENMQTESAMLTGNGNLNLATTTIVPENPNIINFDELVSRCNSSFYIPMDYYTTFNKRAELPDLEDKTGMCFIRCLYEKSGIIENWKLNAEKIRTNIWPATGDSLEVCEKEGSEEKNACVRAYAIAKCLTIRSLVDARNKALSK